jgi:archaellum biogenesis ATPase FlaH
LLEELQSTLVKWNTQVVIVDSIAAIVRKENFDEKDREEYFIRLVNEYFLVYIAPIHSILPEP